MTYFYQFNVLDIIVIATDTLWLIQFMILFPLQHSHIPLSFGVLDRFVYSPVMHHVHHSSIDRHWDKNFGSSLTLWDRMFNTFYHPMKGEVIEFGLDNNQHEEYNLFLNCLVIPFRRAWWIVTEKLKVGTIALEAKDPPG